MRFILFFSLCFVYTVASGFFPSTVHTVVKRNDNGNILIAKPFPLPGMSGIVIHRYGNAIDAAVGYVVQESAAPRLRKIEADPVEHDALPTVKTPPQKGDRVIGGYLYDNVMVLAPDAHIYDTLTHSYRKHWFHPDLLAAYLSAEGDGYPTPQNLKAFALTYQVGLFLIVDKDRLKLYDPISGHVIASKKAHFTPKSVKYPFFMRFDRIQTGLFGDEGDGNYYHVMEQFK